METRNAGANYHMDLYNKRDGSNQVILQMFLNFQEYKVSNWFLFNRCIISFNQEYSLGYNFDSRFVKKLGLESLRLTMNANNLSIYSLIEKEWTLSIILMELLTILIHQFAQYHSELILNFNPIRKLLWKIFIVYNVSFIDSFSILLKGVRNYTNW